MSRPLHRKPNTRSVLKNLFVPAIAFMVFRTASAQTPSTAPKTVPSTATAPAVDSASAPWLVDFARRPHPFILGTSSQHWNIYVDSSFPIDQIRSPVLLTWTTLGVDSPERLNRYGNLAFSSDASMGKIELLLRDYHPSEKGSVEKQLNSAFENSKGTMSVVVANTKEEGGVTSKVLGTPGDLFKIIESAKSDRTIRYMVFENAVFITISPPSPDESRKALLRSYSEQTGSLLASISDKNSDIAKSACVTFAAKTDAMFRQVNSDNLSSDKLRSYELQWSIDKSLLTNALKNDDIINWGERATFLQKNVLLAVQKDTCTVQVFASKGLGAEVKYAKKIDAASGQFKTLGPTIATRDLERADYIFQSFRDGKKTGETSVVDCTSNENQNVTIVEQ